MLAKHPSQYFFLAANGKPMQYSIALASFQRALVVYGKVTNEASLLFTLQALKATTSTWATILDSSIDSRAVQGHHNLPKSSCVKKYGRDDIAPQLQLPRRLVDVINSGWVPHIPLHHGLTALCEVTCGKRGGHNNL